MIERHQLPLPGWRIEAPDWMRRPQKTPSPRPRPAADITDAERTAMRAETTHRASAIRIDAERRFHGLAER